MRLQTRQFLLWLLVTLALVHDVFRGEISPIGALCGAVLGVLIGFGGCRGYYQLAKKGIFVYKMSRTERRVMFLVIWPLCLLAAIVLFFARRSYFPEFDIGKAMKSALLTCFFVGFTMSIASIYFLEQRYGNKFHIAKRKK